MIDRLFSAVLTFCLLAAGSLAIGSEWFGLNGREPAVAQAASVRLPTVEVTGRRIALEGGASATAIARADTAAEARAVE